MGKQRPPRGKRPRNNWKEYIHATTKMRVLKFGPGNEDRRWLVCYNALCFAQGKLDGRSELNQHGKLVELMETVATVVNPDRPVDENASWSSPGGGEVIVSELQYQILKRFLTAYIDNCVRAWTRELAKALNWIEEVPEHKEEKKDATQASEPLPAAGSGREAQNSRPA